MWSAKYCFSTTVHQGRKSNSLGQVPFLLSSSSSFLDCPRLVPPSFCGSFCKARGRKGEKRWFYVCKVVSEQDGREPRRNFLFFLLLPPPSRNCSCVPRGWEEEGGSLEGGSGKGESGGFPHCHGRRNNRKSYCTCGKVCRPWTLVRERGTPARDKLGQANNS